MKNLLKSFIITFISAMFIGIILILSTNIDFEQKCDKEKIKSVNNNTVKHKKRNAEKSDIYDILQITTLYGKNIFSHIVINPMEHNVVVNNINQYFVTSYNNKTIEEVYNYGGINFAIDIINKNFNKKINKYLIIESEEILSDFLDVWGSIELDGNMKCNSKSVDIKNNGYYIVDSTKFIKIIGEKNLDISIFNQLLKIYYIQKLPLLDSEIGERIFKESINLVKSNISFADYCKLREINIFFNQ